MSARVRNDKPRFSASAYLASRGWTIAIACAVIAFVAMVNAVLGMGAAGNVFIVVLLALGCALALIIDFSRRRRFYREAAALIGQPHPLDSLRALLDDPEAAPRDLEGQIARGAIECSLLGADDQNAGLREASDDYRRFIETWVHEIKTPLATAKLMGERLDGQDAAALSRELDRIENAVEMVLYHARSSALSRDYLLREVVLADVVREACRRNARFLVEQGCTPRIDVDDDLKVVADRNWLGFMVGQIVVNAAKYGATTIVFSIVERQTGTSAGHTTLQIADDGWGISASDAPKVFERGFIGQNGRDQRYATGMGLYLVATMARAQGLGVGLATEQGRGTRVLITFPHGF